MRARDLAIILIIIILIVNIFIINNQAHQIRGLTYLIEFESDWSRERYNNLRLDVELLETKNERLTDDIVWLSQRVDYLESQVYNHNIRLDNFDFYYQNHLSCYHELMTILYDEGLIDDDFCDGVD